MNKELENLDAEEFEEDDFEEGEEMKESWTRRAWNGIKANGEKIVIGAIVVATGIAGYAFGSKHAKKSNEGSEATPEITSDEVDKIVEIMDEVPVEETEA